MSLSLEAPCMHCYVAGSFHDITPRYSTNKIKYALRSTIKRRRKNITDMRYRWKKKRKQFKTIQLSSCEENRRKE
jgi:hypothetical protein